MRQRTKTNRLFLDDLWCLILLSDFLSCGIHGIGPLLICLTYCSFCSSKSSCGMWCDDPILFVNVFAYDLPAMVTCSQLVPQRDFL